MLDVKFYIENLSQHRNARSQIKQSLSGKQVYERKHKKITPTESNEKLSIFYLEKKSKRNL